MHHHDMFMLNKLMTEDLVHLLMFDVLMKKEQVTKKFMTKKLWQIV